MNDDNPKATGFLILLIIITIFFAGINVGGYFRDRFWEESAVKAGAGEYNSKTSKFQWANPYERR